MISTILPFRQKKALLELYFKFISVARMFSILAEYMTGDGIDPLFFKNPDWSIRASAG